MPLPFLWPPVVSEQTVHTSVVCCQCRWVGKQVQVGLCLQEVRHKGRRQIQAIKTFPVALLSSQGLELELSTESILVKTGPPPSWVAWDASIQLPLKKLQQPFLLCWLQWPEVLVLVFLRNIPVQITKGHPEEGVSIIPKATGDSLGGERD